MKLQQSILEVQLSPLSILLRAVLDQLQEKDQAKIFAQPVSIEEVSRILCMFLLEKIDIELYLIKVFF